MRGAFCRAVPSDRISPFSEVYVLKEIMDAASFKEMFLCANAALEENKQIINDLNVFPVPDGDTGTNMSLTMNSAAIALRQESFDEIGKASKCAANALLRGARGNSGVILSLLFRGISKSLKGKVTADAPEFAAALTAGVEAAYKAVMKPAEGTILTVSRVAAAAAVEFAKDNADIELMFDCLLSAAKTALAETIHQNPVLERAGVVDAGGQGFVVVMDAMLAWLQGRAVAPVEAKLPEQEQKAAADFSEFDTGDIHFAYCTEFIAARESQKHERPRRGAHRGAHLRPASDREDREHAQPAHRALQGSRARSAQGRPG